MVNEHWYNYWTDVIKNFEKEHGKDVLGLACHAALPIEFKPEFLNLLRKTFFPHLDFIAEANILISNLFRIYVDDRCNVENSIKEILLQRLKDEYGVERMRQIASLLWQYNEKYAPWREYERMERAQQLTAMYFLDRQKAYKWLECAEMDEALSEYEKWFMVTRQNFSMLDKLMA
jgi:hypothetical protein